MDEAKQMVQLQSMQSNRSNQKSEARQAIDDAARAKKEAIDQTPDATTEEKSS